MIKHGKKSNYQLKFDTSKNNLECFIKKKSLSIIENDKYDKKRKNSRGKPKSLIKKTQEFHEQKFISSIIKNAMQEQFQDPKQVTQMLNKINIQGEQKYESPTNQDDILKNFQIFKQPRQRRELFTPQIGYFPLISKSENKPQKIQQKTEQTIENNNKQMQICLGKQSQWKNFSTQIQTEIDTERSKKQQFTEQYPSLLSNQYYVPVNSNTHALNFQQISKQQQYYPLLQSSTVYMGLSKEQRQRKSTPIRGQNQQFRIKIDRIQFDGRTTVMIRHIPNKYTQQMLIDQINENHKQKYNFFYLPVDSYNPCNVGYAFINFIDTKFIAKFYLEFNQKRWNKFNSEKICQLAYARIQGSKALINHFQNSNVMHSRDKRYRPFISFGDNYSSSNNGR